MAQKEIVRLRELTAPELANELKEAKKELFDLKRQLKAGGQLTNTSLFGKVKNKMAQILTVVREQELAKELAEETSHA